MKKYSILFILLIIILGICGCKNNAVPDTPNVLVPAIMYDGDIFCTTGKQMSGEIDESAVVGTITSTVPLSQWPKENGQANFNAIDAPYAITSDGLVVLMENEWTLFEKIVVDD